MVAQDQGLGRDNMGSDAALPAGILLPYAGAAAPSGWLLYYGQAVSRSTYGALFNAIGTTYGAGDGSTTFNLPDLRGRIPAGKDNMGGTAASRLTTAGSGVDGATLGAAGGGETHTLTSAQMPSHTHTGTTDAGGTHTHPIQTIGGAFSAGAAQVAASTGGNFTTLTQSGQGAHTHTMTTSSAGSGGAHPNVQPTLVTTYIIKT